jgi:hypothetical protein
MSTCVIWRYANLSTIWMQNCQIDPRSRVEKPKWHAIGEPPSRRVPSDGGT